MLAALAGIALVLTGCGSAQSAGTGTPPPASTPTGLPSAAEARTIVADLWAHREAALTSLDATALKSIETQAALPYDTGYVTFVACGCMQQNYPHPMLKAVTFIPHSSVDGSFMAAVRTDNGQGQKPWYIIGVERDSTGRWAIGFVAFGGYTAVSELETAAKGNGSAAVTAQTEQAYSAQASSWARYVETHSKTRDRTSYGATVKIAYALDPDDGFVGLALPRGQVLTCFTVHVHATYSMPGGLAQSDARNQWGPQLAPGGYSSITSDAAKPECTVGTGIKPGAEIATYDQRVVATTGTPLHG